MAKKESALTTLRQSLEAALAADPDDLAAHSAYADHLVEQGDPRGEFIQVQLALEDESRTTTERQQLKERESTLRQQHQREWLGDLAPLLLDAGEATLRITFSFARGWLDALIVPQIDVTALGLLGRSATARLLRRLHLDSILRTPAVTVEGPGLFDPAPAPAAEVIDFPCLENIEEFRLGAPGEHAAAVPWLLALLAQQPRLRKLYLHANLQGNQDEALARLANLSQLRVLEVNTDRFDLGVLAGNPALAKLTRLRVRLPANQIGLDCAGVLAVLRSLRRLKELRLGNCDHGDMLCRYFARRGLPAHLTILELSHSGLTNRMGHLLARSAGIERLELLDVTGNRLTDDAIDALMDAAGGDVIAADQRSIDDTYDEIQE